MSSKKELGDDLKPRGAPTKYKEAYCLELIVHMSDGYTFESFAGRPGVSVNRDTLYEWLKHYPEFSDAKSQGRACQQFSDEETLKKLTRGEYQGGSASAHIFKMKNCHGWKDKSEVENVNVEKSYEQYIKELGEKND